MTDVSRRKLQHDFEHVGQQIENFEQGLRFVKRVIYDMNCNWKVSMHILIDLLGDLLVDLNHILSREKYSCTQKILMSCC